MRTAPPLLWEASFALGSSSAVAVFTVHKSALPRSRSSSDLTTPSPERRIARSFPIPKAHSLLQRENSSSIRRVALAKRLLNLRSAFLDVW